MQKVVKNKLSEEAKAYEDGVLAANSYSAYFISFFIPRDWKYWGHFRDGMNRGVSNAESTKRERPRM